MSIVTVADDTREAALAEATAARDAAVTEAVETEDSIEDRLDESEAMIPAGRLVLFPIEVVAVPEVPVVVDGAVVVVADAGEKA